MALAKAMAETAIHSITYQMEQGYANSGWGQNYAPVYDQHYPQENVYSLPGTDDIADDPVYPEPPARKPKAAE